MIENVIDEVELIQREAYIESGYSEAEIEQVLASETANLIAQLRDEVSRFCRENNIPPEGAALIEHNLLAKANANRSTRFQAPEMALELNRAWDLLVEKSGSGIDRLIDRKPIIASAPTGNINAHALRDVQGRSAILLETALLDAIRCVAGLVGLVIMDQSDGGLNLYLDPLLAVQRLQENGVAPELDRLFRHLIRQGDFNMMTTFYGVLKMHTPYREIMVGGALEFVMAHEIAHFARGHDKTFDDGKPFHRSSTLRSDTAALSDAEVQRTSEKLIMYGWKYPPDLQQYVNFKVLQTREVEADLLGFCILTAGAKKMESQLPLFELRLLGGVMFLWIAEMIERYIRLFELGPDDAEHPLFGVDSDLQDMVFRGTHPSAATRLRRLTTNIAHLSNPASVISETYRPYAEMLTSGLSRWGKAVAVRVDTLSAIFEEVWQYGLQVERDRPDCRPHTSEIAARWKHRLAGFAFLSDDKLLALMANDHLTQILKNMELRAEITRFVDDEEAKHYSQS